MKLFTIDMQCKEFNLVRIPIMSHIQLKKGYYTGDTDRLGVKAYITGVKIQSIDKNHYAFDNLGCTHEEVYTVKYSDGRESVVWLEECEESHDSI